MEFTRRGPQAHANAKGTAMSKPSHNPIDRTRVFEEMTPATQSLATEFSEKLDRDKRDGLMLRHELGQRLGQVIQSQSSYGAHAIDQLAQYLGVSPDSLYKLRNFAQTYARPEIEQWASRKMASGGRLTFHHLATIMTVKSADDRLRLVNRVFEESLSIRALRALL